MTRPIGNVRLKAARQHAGYGSQQALADALTRAATQLGLGHIEISSRQVRRWESAAPPWPRADHQRLLVHVLQLSVEDLGFTPPWEVSVSGPDAAAAARRPLPPRRGDQAALPLPRDRGVIQPSTVASDYAVITAAYRRLHAESKPPTCTPPSSSTPAWASTCSARRPVSATQSWPPPWPSPCCWQGASSSSTCGSPTTPTPPLSARCKPPVKPMTPCSGRRSWRTRHSSPAGLAAATR